MDWKYIYQSRNWVEKALLRDDIESTLDHAGDKEIDEQPWKVSGRKLLAILCDMILENGIHIHRYFANHRHPE
jgi:hypothetical protein